MEGLNITWQCLHSFFPPNVLVTTRFLAADDLLSMVTLVRPSIGKKQTEIGPSIA